jgi:hypothetical protein
VKHLGGCDPVICPLGCFGNGTSGTWFVLWKAAIMQFPLSFCKNEGLYAITLSHRLDRFVEAL